MRSCPVRARAALAAAAVVLLGAACSGVRPMASRASMEPSQPSRMVSQKEIEDSGARTAWDVLRRIGRVRLRENSAGQPTDIYSTRGRGTLILDDAPMVVLDGVRLLDFAVLRQVRAEAIQSIEFMGSGPGTLKHGTGASGGVIVISTRM